MSKIIKLDSGVIGEDDLWVHEFMGQRVLVLPPDPARKEPWLVGADITRLAGYSDGNGAKALQTHVSAEYLASLPIRKVDPDGQTRQRPCWFVAYPGACEFFSRTRKDNEFTDAFQKFFFGTVMPGVIAKGEFKGKPPIGNYAEPTPEELGQVNGVELPACLDAQLLGDVAEFARRIADRAGEAVRAEEAAGRAELEAALERAIAGREGGMPRPVVEVFIDQFKRHVNGFFPILERMGQCDPSGGNVGDDWDGPTMASPCHFVDAALGGGFKTQTQAFDLMRRIGLVKAVERERREPGSYQVAALFDEEMIDAEKLIVRGFAERHANTPFFLVLPKGRAFVQMMISRYGHEYDLRPWGERITIRGMICSRSHCGELIELREAFEQDRPAKTTRFVSVLKPKKLSPADEAAE